MTWKRVSNVLVQTLTFAATLLLVDLYRHGPFQTCTEFVSWFKGFWQAGIVFPVIALLLDFARYRRNGKP